MGLLNGLSNVDALGRIASALERIANSLELAIPPADLTDYGSPVDKCTGASNWSSFEEEQVQKLHEEISGAVSPERTERIREYLRERYGVSSDQR